MHVDTNISALSRLIASMKPTFLPTGAEENLRIVPLSSATLQDGAFLIRAQETSLLFGTGFSYQMVNGIAYPTFPDMRIVASEKDRLAAWILTEDSIEVALIAQILPTLDFVPVYASRGLISKIRASLVGNPILERCRFFELFTGETSERKIGDIEIATLQVGGYSYLSFRFGDTTIYDARKEVTASLPKTPRTNDTIGLSITDGEFSLSIASQGSIHIFSGEIISLRPKKIEKHTLKFTFDTFYIDKQSI